MPKKPSFRQNRLQKIKAAVDAVENCLLELNKRGQTGRHTIARSKAFPNLYYLERLAKKANVAAIAAEGGEKDG